MRSSGGLHVRLQGKVALITGGASGLGRATAERYAAEGAAVLLADIQADAGQAAAAEIIRRGGRAAFGQADMREGSSVAAAVQAAMDAFGGLDILVNCAGASGRRHGDGPVGECTEEGWDWVLGLNLRGVFLGCKYAVQAMEQRGGGAIVNVASVLGLVGAQDHFTTHAYAASKGGVIALTRSIAVYYARQNIRCNAICPGLMRTPMSQRALSDPEILEALKWYQPLGQVGEPADVAEAAVYLGSDEARFVTGVVLPVDGGWTAQ